MAGVVNIPWYATVFRGDKLDFERYWYGEDFSDWRRDYSSFYQVPIVYSWNDLVFQGALEPAAANGGAVQH